MTKKQKAPIASTVSSTQTGLAINEGKKHKIEGKRYTLKEEYQVLSHLKPLIAGCILIECNDGFYAVEIDCHRLYYRLGVQIMDKIKHILQ